MNKLVDDFMSGDRSVVLTGSMLEAVRAEIERLRKAADVADGAWNALMRSKEEWRAEAAQLSSKYSELCELHGNEVKRAIALEMENDRLRQNATGPVSEPQGARKTPSHIMCIGWETIRRLAAGESLWFEDLQCGAVAADDLHGAEIPGGVK